NYACDRSLHGIRTQQRRTHKMHAPEGEKADWPHAQMLLAGGAKGSLCNTDSCADIADVKRPVGICCQKFLETGDDRIVTGTTYLGFYADAVGKAPNQNVKQMFLQRPEHLRD